MNTNHPDYPSWQLPHGPSQDCRHHNDLHESWRGKRSGCYPRRFDARRIRRDICHSCGVSLSSQSFEPGYYPKRLDILPRLMTLSAGAMANLRNLRLGCQCLAWAKRRDMTALRKAA